MIRVIVMEFGRFIRLTPHFLVSGGVTSLLHQSTFWRFFGQGTLTPASKMTRGWTVIRSIPE
jgi:hypothetical protein